MTGGRYLAEYGPLGMAAMRNNKGRGATIGDGAAVRGAVRRQIVLQAGSAGGQPHDRNRGDALSQALCVSLSYEDANEANALTPVTLQAELSWGTDGYQHMAVLDWRRGQTLRIPGSFIRIVATQVEDANTETFPADAAAFVGATVGYGFAGVTPATLTQSIQVDAAGSEVLRVPKHAHAFQLAAEDPSSTTITWQAQQAGAPISALPAALLATPGPFPRPNGGHYVEVSNGGASAERYSLVWLLDV